MRMKLKDARKLLIEIRDIDEKISVRPHAWKDHPERRFTSLELVRLLRGRGILKDNQYPTAQPNSFLWICKDDDSRKTEIAIIFEKNKSGHFIVIIHAFREVNDENSDR